MRETRRCQMSVPARSLTVATSIVAAISRRRRPAPTRVPERAPPPFGTPPNARRRPRPRSTRPARRRSPASLGQRDFRYSDELRRRPRAGPAPSPAYALQAKRLLLQHGLREGADYTVKQVGAVVFPYRAMIEDKANAAGILNLAFTVEAAERGLKSLGGLVDLLGPYQAAGAFVMRAWARGH